MLGYKTHSTLNTTKTGTPSFESTAAILKQSIRKISGKYSTAQCYYVIRPINAVIENKPCRLRTMLQDEQCNKSEETIQKYFRRDEGQQTAGELFEYYKYYNQSSIIYQPSFFKIMFRHRQLKKTIEYNKLKIILDLHETNEEQTERVAKNNVTPNCTENVLGELEGGAGEESQQSVLLRAMKIRLETTLGPNCFATVEQLDHNYYFQRRNGDQTNLVDFAFKKAKIPQKIGDNLERQYKYKISKVGRRNNSCESLNSDLPKAVGFKGRGVHQKKHQSMDNCCQFTKDVASATPCGEPKRRLFQNWVKPSESSKSRRIERRILTQKSSIYVDCKQNEKEKSSTIKGKILEIKKRIRRERELMSKKVTSSTNQSDTFKVSKKCSAIPSSNERFGSKKIVRPQFC